MYGCACVFTRVYVLASVCDVFVCVYTRFHVRVCMGMCLRVYVCRCVFVCIVFVGTCEPLTQRLLSTLRGQDVSKLSVGYEA